MPTHNVYIQSSSDADSAAMRGVALPAVLETLLAASSDFSTKTSQCVYSHCLIL